MNCSSHWGSNSPPNNNLESNFVQLFLCICRFGETGHLAIVFCWGLIKHGCNFIVPRTQLVLMKFEHLSEEYSFAMCRILVRDNYMSYMLTFDWKSSQTTIWRVWFDIPWPVGMLCLHILSLSLLGNHLFYYLKSDTRRYIIFFAWGYVIYFESMQIFPSFNGGKHLIEIISPQQDSLLNTQNLFYVKIGITICNLKVTGFDVWLHYNAPLALYTIWKIMVWAHPQLFRWEIQKHVCWHIYDYFGWILMGLPPVF